MKPIIQKLLPKIIKIRHQIHANPELANEEIETASLIAKILKNFGCEVATGIAGTGVCALLDSGKPGRTVALRAEMDALPIQEESNSLCKSKNAGKMHACGHDGHMATQLAVAGALSECKDQFKGKIKFIFQPAEETAGSGALAMINNDALEYPKVDAIFCFHGTHRYEVNKLVTKVGCLMAGHDTFTIRIKGRGGYASSPNAACDPIYIGSLITQAVQNITSRVSSPIEPAIISITQFHAGNTYNVIPNEAFLNGSIRTVTADTQEKIKRKIINIATGIVNSFDATVEIDFEHHLSPTFNYPEETELVLRTAKRILREENIISTLAPIMAPEGFSNYLERVPGCFFFMGNGSKRGTIHKADYEFNDDLIPIAAEILGTVAMDYLNFQPS